MLRYLKIQCVYNNNDDDHRKLRDNENTNYYDALLHIGILPLYFSGRKQT